MTLLEIFSIVLCIIIIGTIIYYIIRTRSSDNSTTTPVPTPTSTSTLVSNNSIQNSIDALNNLNKSVENFTQNLPSLVTNYVNSRGSRESSINTLSTNINNSISQANTALTAARDAATSAFSSRTTAQNAFLSSNTDLTNAGGVVNVLNSVLATNTPFVTPTPSGNFGNTFISSINNIQNQQIIAQTALTNSNTQLGISNSQKTLTDGYLSTAQSALTTAQNALSQIRSLIAPLLSSVQSSGEYTVLRDSINKAQTALNILNNIRNSISVTSPSPSDSSIRNNIQIMINRLNNSITNADLVQRNIMSVFNNMVANSSNNMLSYISRIQNASTTIFNIIGYVSTPTPFRPTPTPTSSPSILSYIANIQSYQNDINTSINGINANITTINGYVNQINNIVNSFIADVRSDNSQINTQLSTIQSQFSNAGFVSPIVLPTPGIF